MLEMNLRYNEPSSYLFFFACRSPLIATAEVKKEKEKKKDLLQYIQLQNERKERRILERDEQWKKEYSKIYKAYNEKLETLEREYEELNRKALDTDYDDIISLAVRAYLIRYVREYLSSFPELSKKDNIPKFSGSVSEIMHNNKIRFRSLNKLS